MRTDDLSLPNDMDLLKAMVRAMAEKAAVKDKKYPIFIGVFSFAMHRFV